MRKLIILVGVIVAGACSLAIIGCAAPLLIILRGPRHQPRASDLDAGPDDPGVDLDDEQAWRDRGAP